MVGQSLFGQVRLESKLHRFNDTIPVANRYGYFKKPTATMADCVYREVPIEGLRQFNVLASKLFGWIMEHLADWLNYLENPTLIYLATGGALDVHDPHDGIKVYRQALLLNMKPIYLHPSEAAETITTYASQEHGLFLPEDPKKRSAAFMLFKAWVFFRVPEYALRPDGLRDFEIREVVMSEKK
ncbi:hypothetical protein SPFM10_00223 [Salmonella phage SPFM10]|nr:hypothetical protein SPFM10_00223 [Salmonella phage SPFM10]